MNYTWDFSVVWEFRGPLLGGLWVSLQLTFFCIFVGTIMGAILTPALSSASYALRWPASCFVEVARALPAMVIMICVYYMLPPLIGVSTSAYWTAAFSLAVNMTGFAAEIFHGNIYAIPREHIEAGYALGMLPRTVLRRIILPEAFRRSVPALTAMYITMFKLSTVASVISVYELLHTANSIIVERFKPLEIYATIAFAYLCVIIPGSYLAKRIQRHRWFAVVPEADE